MKPETYPFRGSPVFKIQKIIQCHSNSKGYKQNHGLPENIV